MKSLTLLRHAKSQQESPDGSDIDAFAQRTGTV